MPRIVVTGSEGFIGKHMVHELEMREYEVVKVDSKSGQDILDPNLSSLLEKGDKVLHLAAISTFSAATEDPLKAVEVNVKGTLNVLKCAVQAQCERVVYSSTGSVYSKEAKLPIDEKQPLRPDSIYGLAKYQAEEWVRLFADKIPHVILRYAYIYGPGKTWGAVGNWIKKLKENKPPTVFGGHQENDFTYVGDIIEANFLALKTKYTNEAYNIGTGKATPILDVLRMCVDATGSEMAVILKKPRSFEYSQFVYDVGKARALLGYRPKWDVEKGIKETVKGWTG